MVENSSPRIDRDQLSKNSYRWLEGEIETFSVQEDFSKIVPLPQLNSRYLKTWKKKIKDKHGEEMLLCQFPILSSLFFPTLSDICFLERNHPYLNIHRNSRYPSNWTPRLFLFNDIKLFQNVFSSMLLHPTSDILTFILLPEPRNTCHKRWIFLPCSWLKKNRVTYIYDLVSTLNTAVIPPYHYCLVLKVRSRIHNVSKHGLRKRSHILALLLIVQICEYSVDKRYKNCVNKLLSEGKCRLLRLFTALTLFLIDTAYPS